VCAKSQREYRVERFKYLAVVFTSDGRQDKEVDTRIDKADAVLRELYRSVVTKRELSNIVKLSVFKTGIGSDLHLCS